MLLPPRSSAGPVAMSAFTEAPACCMIKDFSRAGVCKFSSLLTDTVWAVSPAARSAATTRPACSFSVIEGEGFWSGMKVTQDQFGGITGSLLTSSASIKNRWDYDVAARFGLAFDRALVYGKAGWVAGRFDWNSATLNCTFVCTATQASATLHGLLIGLGLEYAFFNNWTAKFEYDYLGFGSKNVLFTTTCSGIFCFPSPITTNTQSVSADKHI